MTERVKEYNYTRKVVLKDGSISIQKNTIKRVVKDVNISKPKNDITGEQIEEILNLLAMGVKKKCICDKFNIDYHKLKKLLKNKDI